MFCVLFPCSHDFVLHVLYKSVFSTYYSIKLSFCFSVFWFFVFLYLWSLDLCFELNVILKDLKVVSATFLVVCFSSLNESTSQTKKNAFYFTSRYFSFSKQSNFRILDFQILWRHQIPKHKTRNAFQTQPANEIWSFYVIFQKKWF